jgi:hypothetical protein
MNTMKNFYFKYFFLCLSPLGFAQIPKFPTLENPNPSTFQNYSDHTFTNPNRNNKAPSVPQNYNSNTRTPQAYQQDVKRAQEDIRRFEQEQAEAERTVFYSKVKALEDSGYNLPSLSGKAGTKAYYDAFAQLSSLDAENYSTTEANFIVENAFYDNKQNFQQFKAGIQQTAKQVLQKMRTDKLDTEDNTMKNIALFKHFSKNYKYDFDDYFGAKDWAKMFTTKLMKTGKGQCHSMPLLYLMIAEQMGAQASLATAPNHTYIKFLDNEDQWQNIELTNGIFTTNSMILESGYIGSEALQNNLYMNSLSKKELMSQFYADLANGYIHKYGMDEFVGKTLDKSLEYYPNNMYANLLKSMYQQARFKHVTDNLGIRNAENPEELQNIRYFPKAVELLQQTKAQFDKIDNLGFKFMSSSAYSEWLGNMGREANRQQSEEIAERIKQMNAEKQRKKQEDLKKAQEEKRRMEEKKKKEEEERRRLFYLKT